MVDREGRSSEQVAPPGRGCLGGGQEAAAFAVLEERQHLLLPAMPVIPPSGSSELSEWHDMCSKGPGQAGMAHLAEGVAAGGEEPVAVAVREK